MIHEWTVTRGTPVGDAVVGVFDMGGGSTLVSLERTDVLIPEGRYRVRLTESARAKAGTLWSPYPDEPFDPPSPLDHRLPLICDVPRHDGIRIHAFNSAKESLGCIGVGTDHTAMAITHSRPAVTRIVNELAMFEADGDEVYLTVKKG